MSKYQTIKRLFEEKADADKAEAMAAYMKNHFRFYGIQTPERKAIIKEFLKAEKKQKTVDWAFLDACWADEHREFQYVVKDYLVAMKKWLRFDDITRIEAYVRSKQWWDSIDFLDTIIGYIGLEDKRVDELMLAWAQDENFWVRRLAINHQRGRKNLTDTDLLEKILVLNFGSDEFFINKAIGWALRDYSKSNRDWVADFVARYAKKMDPMSVREASKYL